MVIRENCFGLVSAVISDDTSGISHLPCCCEAASVGSFFSRERLADVTKSRVRLCVRFCVPVLLRELFDGEELGDDGRVVAERRGDSYALFGRQLLQILCIRAPIIKAARTPPALL